VDNIRKALVYWEKYKQEATALFWVNSSFVVCDMLKEQIGMCDMAIQALEKQIPKPPTYETKEKYKALGKNYYCSCGVMFIDFERNGTNFCGNCGQRLEVTK